MTRDDLEWLVVCGYSVRLSLKPAIWAAAVACLLDRCRSTTYQLLAGILPENPEGSGPEAQPGTETKAHLHRVRVQVSPAAGPARTAGDPSSNQSVTRFTHPPPGQPGRPPMNSLAFVPGCPSPLTPASTTTTTPAPHPIPSPRIKIRCPRREAAVHHHLRARSSSRTRIVAMASVPPVR